MGGKTTGNMVTKLKTMFRTKDNDSEQTLVRFLFASLIVIYASAIDHAVDYQILDWSFSTFQLISIIYLLVIACISLAKYFIDINHHILRGLLLTLDILFLSTGMTLVAESAVLLFFVYLWVILGFGFRYGNRYLLVATAMSLAGFGFALIYSEYWQTHRMFGIGVLLALYFLPTYVSYFIHRLNTAKRHLETALEKADAANVVKSNFMANINHELRTPLNGVITVSDLLADTPLSKEQREYADTIRTSAGTLLELINDVLDFSKIEAGKIKLDNIGFDLYEAINDVFKLIRLHAKAKDLPLYVNISQNTPQFVTGDPVRLKQILINLASNAVKFTASGYIRVDVTMLSQQGDTARIHFEVTDTGIGISQEAQNHIFERFIQEDESITRRYGGTGLGTSIAKQLVELMGGTIGVASAVGEGSRFWFEISLPVISKQTIQFTDADIVIVSRDEKKIKSLLASLQERGIKVFIVDGFKKLVALYERTQAGDKKRAVIMDETCLDEDPNRAAQLLKGIAKNRLCLMLLSTSTANERLSSTQNFDEMLSWPLDREQFDSILSSQVDDNVSVGKISCVREEFGPVPGGKRRFNILVAEDQTTNQFVFNRILEKDGHRVTMVSDGKQALDVLASKVFDIALLDLHMPEVSGLEVVSLFHFMKPENKMPIIIITANSSKSIQQECDSFADAVLTKPVGKEQLLSTIYRLMNTSKIHGNERPDVKLQLSAPVLFDTTSLEDILEDSGEREFVEELLDMFNTNAKQLIHNAEVAMRKEHDLNKAKEYIHALKGIASNVSARRLSAVAKYYEQVVLSGPVAESKVNEIVGELNDCLVQTNETMRRYVDKKYASCSID